MDRKTHQLTSVCEVEGPCHGSASFSDGRVFISTGVEGGQNEKDRYARLKEVHAVSVEDHFMLKKSVFPFIMQYGVMRFPAGTENTNRVVFTAMGLKNWSPANITRILKNPFYCGIIVYRKQYVPDYLEQKKINNFGAVDKITVEGSHEPIISKEQFAAVQKIIDSKTTTTSNRRKTGTKPFECVWSGKMKCECGGSFNRKIWHTKKDGIKQFAFQCNKQIRTGTVKTRQKKGLSIEGVCTSPMIQDWKLELMAKVILDTLWKDKSEVLRITNELLDECIKESGGMSSREKEIQRYENLISNQQNKLEKLLDMCLNEIITKEDYVKKRSVLEDEIRTNQAMIDTLNADAEDSESKAEKKIKALKDKLNNSLNFNTYHIPDGIIASLVDEIRVYKDRFEWKLKIFNDKATIVTGVDADKNASIITDDSPSYWDSSTGCNRREVI